MRCALLLVVFCLAGCSAGPPSDRDARRALIERMEASALGAVSVKQVHALELSDCAPAAAGGVVCQVAMDVSFEFRGAQQRSDDRGPMRFVREGGRWKAYPVEVAAAP